MPVLRPKMIIGELYHVYNRGVEKRIIFVTRQHYMRFVAAMRFFNTSRQVTLRDFLGSNSAKTTGVQPLQAGRRLVQIGAFILMPNHFHFLFKPLVEGGISLFMQKLGSGYTAFFNLKHSRSGVLFQGRYKVKYIDSDRYARYIQAYIPLNALDRAMPDWRENGIKKIGEAKRIASVYPWSSFSSYIGENSFPDILEPTFIHDFFETKKEFENFVFSWSEDDNKYMPGAVAG